MVILKIFVVCVEEIGSWIETEIWNRTYYVIDYVNMTFFSSLENGTVTLPFCCVAQGVGVSWSLLVA